MATHEDDSALLSPESRTQIADVLYVRRIRAFLIRMQSGRTYWLPLSELPEADSSPVTRCARARNRQYFRVTQESGNRFEVPWDVILYHCDPEYEYYKGKQAVQEDSGKRIGEREVDR